MESGEEMSPWPRGVGVPGYGCACTYAEFLQADSDPFHALQFFAVCCLDALFCLSLISESVQPVTSAIFFREGGVHDLQFWFGF